MSCLYGVWTCYYLNIFITHRCRNKVEQVWRGIYLLNAMKMLHYFQSLKNTQMHSGKERVGSPSFPTPILFRAASSLHRSLAEKATACGLFPRLTDSFTRHKADLLTALVIHTSVHRQLLFSRTVTHPILLCKVPILSVDQVPRRWSIMLARRDDRGTTRVRCRSVNCAKHTMG